MSNPVGDTVRTIITQAVDLQAAVIQVKLEENKMAVYHHREGAVYHHADMPACIFPLVATR